MGRLNVDTASNISRARTGNPHPATVTVSVVNDQGEPVDRLPEAAFRSTTIFVGAGGSSLALTSVRRRSAEIQGLYDVRLAPISGRDWSQGRYVVMVEVVADSDRGRAIAEIVIP